jgi:menaquinone-specific isochorismate synthase
MVETVMLETTRRHDNIFQLQTAPQSAPMTLVSASIPWPRGSLAAFLQVAANGPRVYWDSQKVSLGFAGCGVAAKLTAQGANRFEAMRQQIKSLFENVIQATPNTPEPIGPHLFGGFAFKPEHRSENLWSAFPTACFILPQFQLTRLNNALWLTANYILGPQDDPLNTIWWLQEEARQLQQKVESFCTAPLPENVAINSQAQCKDLMSPRTWHYLVSEATRRIRRKELDKVVLARARKMQSAYAIDPTSALARLERNYPDCYRFLFEPIPGHAFYGATPELLAEIEGSSLRTVALAGSIRRGASPQEDEALGQELLANPKERMEHAFVVEAIEEHIRPLASNLHIAPKPGLRRLSNIHHIETPIWGELAPGHDALSVVEALHPTPALGGRPREIALKIINEAESTPRGWYGSPIGWIDHRGAGAFAVAIRSAVSVGSESMLFAGAGIVADSEPGKEWRETELKFKPLMDALNESNQL